MKINEKNHCVDYVSDLLKERRKVTRFMGN